MKKTDCLIGVRVLVMFIILGFVSMVSLLAFFGVAGSKAYAQPTPYYQGKTIRIIVGFAPGGLYDLWARLIASHMGKHIPGNPDIVGQNMTGAGSLVAANYVYSVAKPDGLTLGAVSPTLYFDQLIGRKEVQFDWARFSWIGTPDQTEFLLFIRADSPYRSLADIRTGAEPPKCGSTGIDSILYYVPKLLEDTIGSKFTIVAGYQGGPDIDLALERGELQCRLITITSFFGREPYHTWRKKGFPRVLVQTGKKRDPRLPDVPTIYELMDQFKIPNAGQRLATVMLAPNMFGRPLVASPAIPPERLKTLREAWNKAVNEPDLLAEAKKREWPVEPIAGEDLESLAKQVISQTPEVIERMKKLLGK